MSKWSGSAIRKEVWEDPAYRELMEEAIKSLPKPTVEEVQNALLNAVGGEAEQVKDIAEVTIKFLNGFELTLPGKHEKGGRGSKITPSAD